MNKIKRSIIFSLALLSVFSILSWNSVFAREKNEFVICIDAGHQKRMDGRGEPVAPGSSKKKARVTQGTEGIGTKKAEYEVNLEAALILKQKLQDKGYKVVMTREINEVSLSNVERAEIANNALADLTIRIHCDSVTDNGKKGATILIPSSKSKYTKNIYEQSNSFGEILKDNLKKDGVKVTGVFERKDITGFNWSKVPVVIFEMGFMSNWKEDKMLSDKIYLEKLMDDTVSSIEEYKTIIVQNRVK